MSVSETGCCPRFDPAPWDGQELVWTDRRFVRDRVHSFLHIPLDFGAAMKRNMARIRAAGAEPAETVVLSDENSLWGADLYIATAKDVPGAQNVTISGTFLAKVFDGPYRDARKWPVAMRAHAAASGRTIKKLYFYYTTCPKCAAAHGHNYVVLLAQV